MKMFRLNKIFLLCSVGVVGVMMSTSCNNEWTDEQYEQYISFKAPLDTEGSSVGVTTVYVPFTRLDADGNAKYGEEGLSSYDLPVIVSGSTHNSRDLTVHVAHSDTLDILNVERFSTRSELYYIDMSDYASYPETLDIPKGQDIGLLNIKFDFRGIDLTDRYVLPLTVVEKPEYGYERNPRKNYATAMLRVLPYTTYSGEYQATNVKFYIVSGGVTDNEPGAMTAVQSYVVNENTVFFYAGTFNESSLLRKEYKVFARFEPYEQGGTRGTVTFYTDNERMNFVQNKIATFTIIEQDDEVQSYIMRRTVIVNDVDYTFTDYSTAPGSEITYNVNGTMSMERKLNTQMPEEDQIIF
ncbi:MAG: DUF4973 domain-containing protein [Muribaculaceae bacterium]|nr:DUF4973 domain-containing protein [Muribaculaceae bacterium]